MEQNNHIAYNKTVRISLSITLILAAIFLFAASVKQLGHTPYPTEAPAQITVSGTGEISASPDTANLSFTVTKEAKDTASAQKLVNDIVTPVVAGLKSKGIADKDISTDNYSTSPVYDYPASGIRCSAYGCPPSGTQVLRGYQTSESITVKVRNIDTAGDILTYLGTQGVTNIQGPNFVVDKADSLKDQARAKAIDDAKAKAQVLAGQLGVHIVKVVSFNEGGNYPMMYAKSVSMDSVSEGAVPPAPATVPTGENKFTSNVTIVYEVE